jgi:hypothetical protein
VSDGCRDKKDNGFKRIQAVRTPTDYNLYPIVTSLKGHKDDPVMRKRKKLSRLLWAFKLMGNTLLPPF